MEEVQLPGGIANQGAVVRVGDTVRRPRSAQSELVAAVFGHLEEAGCSIAPRFLGFDEQDREVLSWIPGDVPLPPFPDWSMSDAALRSVARLLRSYHDALDGFQPPVSSADWSQELADPEGGVLVCHNDVCPENVIFRGGEAVALVDFDFAAPGRRLWDVVSTTGMWAPLVAPEWRREHPAGLDAIARTVSFANAYGLADAERQDFPTVLEERWSVGHAFIRRRLQAGEAAFEEMVAEYGADERWTATAQWMERVGDRLAHELRD